jgi:hypothetical protein
MRAFAEWESFYVIVGSAGAVLIGLQFVVVTLVAEMPMERDQAKAGAAFATPTIVHFGAVLLQSAILSAPWQDVAGPALLLGVLGLSGIAYEIIVARRMQSQRAYAPELEDWWFHALLPFAAYTVLAGSAYAARFHGREPLFLLGGAALLLLFIGIHNAWDAVTYHVFVKRGQTAGK